MKSPPAKLHASYIQSMCLSKNVFVSPPDLHSLALRHHGDVRRSLLNLQFWIDSNAGYCDPGGISFATEIKIDTSTSDNLAEKASFSVSEKRQWDNKAAVYGSLTTNNMKQPCDSTEVCDTSSSNYGKHGVAGKMSRSMDCVVHQLCLESYLGLRNVASANEGSALKVLASEWAQDTFSAKVVVFFNSFTWSLYFSQ